MYFTLPTHKVWLYEQYLEEYRANLHAAFLPLCRLARVRKITLSVENGGGMYQLPHMAAVLQELLR